MTTTPAATGHLSAADAATLQQLLNIIPFGKTVRNRDIKTVQDVVTALTDLGDELMLHSERDARVDEELRYHRDILDGGRALFAALAEPRD